MLRLGAGDRAQDLPSQPTLSRFEHTPTPREVVQIGRRFERLVIERLALRHPNAQRIILDPGGTVDPAFGQQDFSCFNKYYDTNCLFPLLGFLAVDDYTEQHLFAARLRPGTSKDPRVSVALIRRTALALKRSFPGASVLVRLDTGFAYPRLLDVLDELGARHIVGFPGNSILTRRVAGHMLKARKLAKDMEGTCALLTARNTRPKLGLRSGV